MAWWDCSWPPGKTALQKPHPNVPAWAGGFQSGSRKMLQEPQTEVVRPFSTSLHTPGGSRAVLSPSFMLGQCVILQEQTWNCWTSLFPWFWEPAFSSYLIFFTGESQKSLSSGKQQDEADFSRFSASPPCHPAKLRWCLSSPILHNKPKS